MSLVCSYVPRAVRKATEVDVYRLLQSCPRKCPSGDLVGEMAFREFARDRG